MVVAVHSLTDFSLHIPANALLVTMIVGLIHLGLHFQGAERGSVPHAPPEGQRSMKISSAKRRTPNAERIFPLWAALPFLILFTLLCGTLCLRTWHTWQADSLARTVWNSTLPVRDPSDLDIEKALRLAPGNARYWAWLASRITQKPEILRGE